MPKFTYWVRLSAYMFLFGFVGYFNDLAIPDGNLVQRNLAPLATGIVLGLYGKSLLPEDDDF